MTTEASTTFVTADNAERWRLYLDPRDAIYPNSTISLSDEDVVRFIDKEWDENRGQFCNVAVAAAFSGRVVALRHVLKLGWPIVYIHHGDLTDDLMSLVLDYWHCTPTQICAMIDLLVEYGDRVDRPRKTPSGRGTPLDIVNMALKYLDANMPLAAVVRAARERLVHHGAKMHSARKVPNEFELECARKSLRLDPPELEDCE